MKNINKFIIFLITITIVLLIHNNKDNFTIVRDLNLIPGMQGNYGPKGPDGDKGPSGPSNEYNDGLMNSQLNNQLKLGSSKYMFNNDYQLKLSGRIKPKGVKLKMNKFESEDDKNYYIKCENKNTTDFYVNNKKLYLNGSFDVKGDIKVRNNNEVRSLVNDRIPSGLIFPYYFDDMSNIGSGFYLLKFDNTGEELQLRLEFHNIKGNEFKISLCNTDYKKFFLKRDTDTNIQYVDNSDDDNCIFSLVKISNKKYKLLNNQKHLYIKNDKNYQLSKGIKEFELLRTVPYGWKLHDKCKGRLIVGDNSNIPNYYKNKTGGSEDITLNQNNLPQHKHKTNVSLEYSIKTNDGTTNAESQHDHSFKVLDRHVDDENGTELAFVLAHTNHVYTDADHNYTPGAASHYNINEFKDKYGELPWTNTGEYEAYKNKSHQLESSTDDPFNTRVSGNHNHQFEAQFARPFFRLDNIDRNNRVTVPFAIAPESKKILYIEKE